MRVKLHLPTYLQGGCSANLLHPRNGLPSHALVVGGVFVAVGLVDGGQGSPVETHGGYRHSSFLGQVGQVGGDAGRERLPRPWA